MVTGHRDELAQDEAVRLGHSKNPWPTSMHNRTPSLAVDVMPNPIDWHDTRRLTYFAGFVMGRANGMGIKLRWGGDWKGTTDVKSNAFDDLTHFELVDHKGTP